MTDSSSSPGSLFDEISTRWTTLSDPTQFVMRYSVAIERYLRRLIANPHDALDVMQSFLLNAVQRGFPQASADRGRFRFYLKTAVRHAALMHFRQQAAERTAREEHAADQRQAAGKLQSSPDPSLDLGSLAIDEKWTSDWRQCLLDRASDAMLRSQRRNPDNLFHTILDLVQRHTDEDSTRLAERLSQATGRAMTAGNFRVQLHRARHEFAKLIVAEVASTLESPHPDAVESELIDTDLMPLVRPLLPDDWRSWSFLRSQRYPEGNTSAPT